MRKNKRDLSQSEFSILTVDDDPIMTVSLQSYFQGAGYRVDVENDPEIAVRRVKEGAYDIMLLDFLMTPICGDQVVERIRKFNRDLYIILLTGHKSMAPPIKTIRELDIQGYYEKSDRFDQLELLVESCMKSIRQMRIIRRSYLEMASAMRLMVDAKDIYTRGHSDRVAFYAHKLALALGRPPEFCERVKIAGLFHDIGKLAVPDDILLAERALTVEEFENIKKHPESGSNIVSVMSLFNDIAPIIRSHHERYDGSGYPDHLSGADIPEESRIISLADAFDAMTSSRRYRKTMTFADAVSEIQRGRGTQFDPAFADVFLQLIQGEDLIRAAHESCDQLRKEDFNEGTFFNPGK